MYERASERLGGGNDACTDEVFAGGSKRTTLVCAAARSEEAPMITKSALCIPFGLLMLVAGAGCGAAAADSEEQTAVADDSAPQTTTSVEPTNPGAPQQDNVGKTQQQQLGWPGFGVGFAAPFGYGFGFPAFGGFGLGTGWGWSSGVSCVNGFCMGY